MAGNQGGYGAVDTHSACPRQQRKYSRNLVGALAGLSVLVICCAGVAVWHQHTRVALAEVAAHSEEPSASRQQQLADVFTAPLEGLAKSVGHAIKSSMDADASPKKTMAADPWNNPTGPGGDPFGIPTYDYTNPYGVTTGTSSSTLGAPPTPEEFKCYFESDWFMRLVRSCCKTLYIPPGLSSSLQLLLAALGS
eukprot:387727-Rhodomonas_salina.2